MLLLGTTCLNQYSETICIRLLEFNAIHWSYVFKPNPNATKVNMTWWYTWRHVINYAIE